MKEQIQTIKVCLMAASGGALHLTEALGAIFSTIGAGAAMAYTVYKLFILHRDEKRKQNELD